MRKAILKVYGLQKSNIVFFVQPQPRFFTLPEKTKRSLIALPDAVRRVALMQFLRYPRVSKTFVVIANSMMKQAKVLQSVAGRSLDYSLYFSERIIL